MKCGWLSTVSSRSTVNSTKVWPNHRRDMITHSNQCYTLFSLVWCRGLCIEVESCFSESPTVLVSAKCVYIYTAMCVACFARFGSIAEHFQLSPKNTSCRDSLKKNTSETPRTYEDTQPMLCSGSRLPRAYEGLRHCALQMPNCFNCASCGARCYTHLRMPVPLACQGVCVVFM